MSTVKAWLARRPSALVMSEAIDEIKTGETTPHHGRGPVSSTR